MYLCAKSIPIANKLVSLENGYKQMFTVLNQLPLSYSNLIGRKKNTCQDFDQATALLESGQKLVTRIYVRPLCSKRVVASERKAKYGKKESQIPNNDQIQLKDVAM